MSVFPRHTFALTVGIAIMMAGSSGGASQQSSRTLVVVLAHADDEAAVAPLVARYTREGVKGYMLIVSDGSEGSGQQGRITRPDEGPTGEALAAVRTEEARCAASGLGMQPPIQLGFPDGKLGDYIGDRARIYAVTQRIAEELQRLHPDVMITWGPDGGTGHPDHRIVSSIVTQLQRTGAPGVPERLFYMNLPVEAMRAASPQRGEPPLVVPQAKYFTTRIAFRPADWEAAKRSMACHKSQMTPESLDRVSAAVAAAWTGAVPLIPAFTGATRSDLFR